MKRFFSFLSSGRCVRRFGLAGWLVGFIREFDRRTEQISTIRLFRNRRNSLQIRRRCRTHREQIKKSCSYNRGTGTISYPRQTKKNDQNQNRHFFSSNFFFISFFSISSEISERKKKYFRKIGCKRLLGCGVIQFKVTRLPRSGLAIKPRKIVSRTFSRQKTSKSFSKQFVNTRLWQFRDLATIFHILQQTNKQISHWIYLSKSVSVFGEHTNYDKTVKRIFFFLRTFLAI